MNHTFKTIIFIDNGKVKQCTRCNYIMYEEKGTELYYYLNAEKTFNSPECDLKTSNHVLCEQKSHY